MKKFETSFLLGAATAAHQVEGNNTNSDCWAMEQMEHTAYVEPSLDAVDHYNRYEEDIRLMAEAVLKEKTTPISGEGVEIPFISTWQRGICRSIEYPNFKAKKEVTIPDRLHEEEPEFSGFVRYENRFMGEAAATYILEISDAYEGVEVFLNGKSLGIQIVPSYRYELSSYVKDGENEIAIEVATTLERETAKYPNPYAKYIGQEVKPSSFSGITGEVRLLKHENEM